MLYETVSTEPFSPHLRDKKLSLIPQSKVESISKDLEKQFKIYIPRRQSQLPGRINLKQFSINPNIRNKIDFSNKKQSRISKVKNDYNG